MSHPSGTSSCPSCGAQTSPGASFCHQCGRPIKEIARPRTAERLTWMATGGALVGVVALILGLLLRRPGAAPEQGVGAPPFAGPADAPSASGGTGVPPDISSMSPRERFDRLYQRIMRSAEAGDEGGVTRFTPMALMAYAQLDTIDADARFHAALLKLHTGDVAGAQALADTILARNPGHLLAYVILGTAARFRKDDKVLDRNYQEFLKHYDAELQAKRPEYTEHRRSLEEFHQAALQAKKS